MIKKSKEKENNRRISVVLPTYNERENVVEVTSRVSKLLGKDLYEIIIVDDNSPDKTWQVVQQMKNPKYKLVRRMKEKGLASALATGLNQANGDIIVWLDCDLGIPPEDIKKLVDKIGPYDVVIGSRYVGSGKDLRSKLRAFYSVLINKFAQLLLGPKIKDYTSGFAAAKKQVIQQVKFSKKGFGEYFVEFSHKCVKKKFRILEVGYSYTDRLRGISKSGDSLKTIIRLGMQYISKVISMFVKDTLGIKY